MEGEGDHRFDPVQIHLHDPIVVGHFGGLQEAIGLGRPWVLYQASTWPSVRQIDERQVVSVVMTSIPFLKINRQIRHARSDELEDLVLDGS
jgi:hypothetical protein